MNIMNSNKKIKIIQPCRIGDIIICLPIAKAYYDNGYEVYWPVCAKYYNLFNYVDYVTPIKLCEDINKSTFEAKEVLPEIQQLDLMINFGSTTIENQSEWENSNYSFDEWKYFKAGVPFSEKTNLIINRNINKENSLIKKFNINLDEPYIVRHYQGTWCKWTFDNQIKDSEFRIIDIEPISDYNIFDWIGVIENCHHIYAVDSCIVNLVNGLKLCLNHRTFRPWWNIYDPKLGDKLIPKMSDNWEILLK